MHFALSFTHFAFQKTSFFLHTVANKVQVAIDLATRTQKK